MPKTIPTLCSANLGSDVNAGTIRYSSLKGVLLSSATETNLQMTIRDSYTLANLWVRVTSNTATGGTTTVRSRKNNDFGALTLGNIQGQGTGIFQDTVDSDSLVDGDVAGTYWESGSGGLLRVNNLGYTLAGNSAILGTNGSVGASGTTTHGYINGEMRIGTTESDKQYIVRTAQTFSNMQIVVSSNGRTDTTTCYFRKNGNNGNQNVSFATLEMGKKEDTVNQDSVVTGDAINYQFTFAGGANTITFSGFYIKTIYSGTYLISGGNLATATVINAGLTRYITTEGTPYGGQSTETTIPFTIQVAGTAKNMFVRVRSNSLNTGTSTIYLRKNSDNGNLNISFDFTQTGTYEDTVNTDVFTATDTINWIVNVSGTTGSIALDYIGCEFAVSGRRRIRSIM